MIRNDDDRLLVERDQLARLLVHLEAEAAAAGAAAAADAQQAIRDCKAAIGWLEQQHAGLKEVLWGHKGIARANAVCLGLLAVGQLALSSRPITLWRVAGQVLIWLVFGVGGGILLGRLHWTSTKARVDRQLAAARALPPAP